MGEERAGRQNATGRQSPNGKIPRTGPKEFTRRQVKYTCHKLDCLIHCNASSRSPPAPVFQTRGIMDNSGEFESLSKCIATHA